MYRNTLRRIIAMTVAVICTVMAFSACNGGEKTYNVTVKDYLGNPYSDGIVVEFQLNGDKVAMQSCDENGIASKVLPAGDYDVVLKLTEEDKYVYNKDISLSAKETSVDVILSNAIGSEPQTLYVEGGEYDAYAVTAGCTYVELKEGRNYYFFTPTEAGTYEFSIADGTDAPIGYYGTPHFVQSVSIAEVVDNKFTISVSATMIGSGEGGTSIYVIGIDSNGNGDCVLGINRIGDAAWSIEDEPWEIYEKTVELTPYTLPEESVIGEFDLTADTDAYNIVFNDSDGYYHLDSADGPLVLVRLAEDCDYIACFKTILERSGVTKYYFDENDEFVKKVSYSECLLEYIENVDETEGVYPLTEDLKYIIQSRGEYVGWWDIESSGYIFKDANGYNLPDINSEIAWLMMCCYIEK